MWEQNYKLELLPNLHAKTNFKKFVLNDTELRR